MSLWSHDPEKYDEIIRDGILHYIDSCMITNGFTVPGEWYEGYEALIETLQVDPSLRSVYEHLERLATSDIIKAEQDYFGGLGDAAKL